jgi:hypothetical protein
MIGYDGSAAILENFVHRLGMAVFITDSFA